MKLPDDWTEHLLYRNGQKVAFFLVKSNEIHCFRSEESKGRWLTRQDLERLTHPIFEQYGHLLTKVCKGNHIGHRFVSRLGFIETHCDEKNIYYRAERLTHARL